MSYFTTQVPTERSELVGVLLKLFVQKLDKESLLMTSVYKDSLSHEQKPTKGLREIDDSEHFISKTLWFNGVLLH